MAMKQQSEKVENLLDDFGQSAGCTEEFLIISKLYKNPELLKQTGSVMG